MGVAEDLFTFPVDEDLKCPVSPGPCPARALAPAPFVPASHPNPSSCCHGNLLLHPTQANQTTHTLYTNVLHHRGHYSPAIFHPFCVVRGEGVRGIRLSGLLLLSPVVL